MLVPAALLVGLCTDLVCCSCGSRNDLHVLLREGEPVDGKRRFLREIPMVPHDPPLDEPLQGQQEAFVLDGGEVLRKRSGNVGFQFPGGIWIARINQEFNDADAVVDREEIVE